MKSVLFVCLGNICRSPTAEAVFRNLAADSGCREEIRVDSAGTGDWHIGHPPDPRAIASALNRGIDISDLKARQVTASDFTDFDYIMAMDSKNREDLMRFASESHLDGHNIELLLRYAPEYRDTEIPDPYYGDQPDFELALEMIQSACRGLLDSILKDHA